MHNGHYVILILLYVWPLIIVSYFVHWTRMAIVPRRLKLRTQLRHYFDLKKEYWIGFYTTRSDLFQQFEDAGLNRMGFTPIKFRLVRDISFIVTVLFLQMQYIISPISRFPIVSLLLLLSLYFSLLLKASFPITIVLKGVQRRFERKKNAEIFIIQQLISIEYSNTMVKQNLYHMFMYIRQFLQYTQPAVDRFIAEYPLNPFDKEKAFRSFAQRIGTKEAEELAEILYQVDQSSPHEVTDLLDRKVEELKKRRQESYRSIMRDRGVVAYVLTFSGIMMVIICGLFVYYLEYKDMMNATYHLN